MKGKRRKENNIYDWNDEEHQHSNILTFQTDTDIIST